MSRKPLGLAVALAAVCATALFCARTKTPFWYGHDATVEAAQVDASVFPFFAKWLSRSASDPLDYIVDKCRGHQLVIVGEQHYIKDYCQLFAKAVPASAPIAAESCAGEKIVRHGFSLWFAQ